MSSNSEEGAAGRSKYALLSLSGARLSDRSAGSWYASYAMESYDFVSRNRVNPGTTPFL